MEYIWALGSIDGVGFSRLGGGDWWFLVVVVSREAAVSPASHAWAAGRFPASPWPFASSFSVLGECLDCLQCRFVGSGSDYIIVLLLHCRSLLPALESGGGGSPPEFISSHTWNEIKT